MCRSLRPVADLNAGPSRGLSGAMPLPGLFPSASHACCFILFTAFLLPAPPSRGHFLMPFLNLAPIPPKSNQIHNLIRQKNEENVRLPASPLTGRRPAANLEIGKCYNGGTTDGWGGRGAGGTLLEGHSVCALSKSGRAHPSHTEKGMERNALA